MKRALFLLALLATPAASAQFDANCPGGRTVSADHLRAAGAGRLGDALRLVAPLRAWTVDGFDAEPRDVRGALTLVLDGIPWQGTSTVEPGMLDALPVAVSEIRDITYCPGGGLVAGRIVGPVLYVSTEPPPNVAALADYGNETGDPGPARYRDSSLPNSDHWGPDGELIARSGRAWATLRARSFLPTDTAIVARTTAVSARFPEHQTLLGVISARSRDGAAASHGRVAAFTSGELPFLPRAEREVAVSRRWAQASGRLDGQFEAPSVDAWGGIRTLSAPPWAVPASVVARVSDWRETFAAGVASFPMRRGLIVGLRGDVMQARGDERLPDFDAPIQQTTALAAGGGVWVDAPLPGAGSRRPRVAGDLLLATRADGGARLGGGLSARSDASLPIGWSATVRRTPAAASPDAGYWRVAGLAPLVRDGGAGADISTDDVSALITVLRPRPTVRGGGLSPTSLSTHLTLSAGWTRSPEPVAVSRGAQPALVRTEAWSRRWVEVTGSVGLEDTHWTLSTDAAVALTASAGDAVWPEAPALQLGTTATFHPDRTLALSARVEASTASNSRAVRGDLPSRIPGGVVVDLSVRRSVWKDRLALALVGHNVFDAPEQPSALGARLGPRLHLRLTGRF